MLPNLHLGTEVSSFDHRSQGVGQRPTIRNNAMSIASNSASILVFSPTRGARKNRYLNSATGPQIQLYSLVARTVYLTLRFH
jgi:hypothetical protein